MATFFSSTDQNTLRDEGQDRNNLVSLIVNNDGTYNAAITRHNKVKSIVREQGTYEFFGEGPKDFTDEYETEDSYIEYFMFDVVRKTGKGILGFLERIKEIARKPKQTTAPTSYGGNYGGGYGGYGFGYEGYKAPQPAVPAAKPAQSSVQIPAPHAQPVAKPAEVKPATTPAPVAKPAVKSAPGVNVFWDTVPTGLSEDKDFFIETLAIQLCTGDMLARATKDFDLDKWIEQHMFNKFKARFGTGTDVHSEFGSYIDNILEYMLFSVTCTDLEGYGNSDKSSLIAGMLYERLNTVKSKNLYLNKILDSLKYHYE